MPKIEKIGEWESLNLSASVGRGGVNLKEDVTVVQALLGYVFRKRFETRKMPVVNGAMDENTVEAIRNFQLAFSKANRHPQLKLIADGLVNPAGKTRTNGRHRLWTIVALNDWAFELWVLSGAPNESYLNDLGVQFPQVKKALDEAVGTLGLSLEPSPPRMGTLGLALE